MPVIVQLRDSDRGSNDYKQGDVVLAVPGSVSMSLPPSADAPFWYIRVEDIELPEFSQYLQESRDAAQNLLSRRVWGVRLNRMSLAQRTFLTSYKHLGFGLEPYFTQYGVIYPNIYNDVVVFWSEFRTWLFSKVTGKSA